MGLTIDDVRKRVKVNSKILWPYRGHVESGDVTAVYGDQVDVIWLEGYKSRNDTVPMAEVLSLYDPKGPRHEVFPFIGTGFITEAGEKWVKEHPKV